MEGLTNSEAQPKIRAMVGDDILSVVDIWNRTTIDFKSGDNFASENNAEKGFFVRELSDAELKILIESDESICLIRESKSIVEGFLIAMSLNSWITLHPDWKETVAYEKESIGNDQNKVVWIYSIYSSGSDQRLAAALQKELKEKAVSKGFTYELGQILRTPVRNVRSERFHKALGFSKIGTRQDSHGDQPLIWDLYGRELGK